MPSLGQSLWSRVMLVHAGALLWLHAYALPELIEFVGPAVSFAIPTALWVSHSGAARGDASGLRVLRAAAAFGLVAVVGATILLIATGVSAVYPRFDVGWFFLTVLCPLLVLALHGVFERDLGFDRVRVPIPLRVLACLALAIDLYLWP